jgi:SPP1 family predicted phage head-tail adaptor
MVEAVSAGKLKHRVRLMRAGITLDGGRAKPMPTEVAKLWAWVQPLAARELIQIRQVLPEVTHRVVLHFRPDVNNQNWLEHDGRRLAILSVINTNEDNTVLELLCVEQLGGA